MVYDEGIKAETYQMRGTASFTVIDSNIYNYSETVSVRRLNSEMPFHDATRDYIFKRLAKGFAVYFKETEELFHNIEFSGDNQVTKIAAAAHTCKADIYNSTYVFQTPDRFEVLHKVVGPKKDYVISTVYTRTS